MATPKYEQQVFCLACRPKKLEELVGSCPPSHEELFLGTAAEAAKLMQMRNETYPHESWRARPCSDEELWALAEI